MSTTKYAAKRPMTADEPRGSVAKLWILGSWQDLLLFIATPLLILPLFFVARSRFSIEQIALWVAAFGATGHHLPGMLRAYGDRELFLRYRLRFILAPLLLFGLAVACALSNIRGLILVAVIWATWHALMQVHGFSRIYDAKVKSFSRVTAWLDMLMCLAWFGAGVFCSSARLGEFLNEYYLSGGRLISPGTLHALQSTWMVFTALVTTLFAVNLLWRWKNGEPPNPLKLALMLTSFGFWWYAMVIVNDTLLGVALFEIFHDIQYLSIVWVFNRKRADHEAAGSFTRFLFRRSGTLLGLYLGLVFAYGMIGLLPERWDEQALIRKLLGALLVTSGLLHFYYDGFIWKVREKSTRTALGLEGGEGDTRRRVLAPAGVLHFSRWGLFVVPVAVLSYLQMYGAARDEMNLQQNIVAAVPGSWKSHVRLGTELQRRKRYTTAELEFRRAVELNPESGDAHYHLGNLLAEQNRDAEAKWHLMESLKHRPEHVEAHVDLGVVLTRLGSVEKAFEHLQTALSLDPQHGMTNYNMAQAYFRKGNWKLAIIHYNQALRVDPRHFASLFNRGMAQVRAKELVVARSSFEAALNTNPESADGWYQLGMLDMSEGDIERANTLFRRAIDTDPTYIPAMNILMWNLATSRHDELRDGAESLRIAQKAVELSGRIDVGVLNGLAAALAETGDFDAAVATIDEAIEQIRKQRMPHLMATFERTKQRYLRREAVRE
ncbi:MAG: tetratricopeptide repeat protein [Planctomycetaceae bacterium]